MPDHKSILVVEDDVDLCNSILTSLSRSGYKPTGATEFKDASFRLRTVTFACVLLDMHFGTEPKGEELIELMRNRQQSLNPNTPIIVISGFLDRDLVTKIAPKIKGALVKPFDMEALLAAVGKAIGEK